MFVHTDLTNLTEAALLMLAATSGVLTLGRADSKGEATCHFVRFMRSV